jgi:hypothetical protein
MDFGTLVVEVVCGQPQIRFRSSKVATAECSKQSTNFGEKAVVMACSPESRAN